MADGRRGHRAGYAGPVMGLEATTALRARVTAALARQGVSGRELARRTGADEKTVRRFLAGDGGVWRRTAEKLTAALGLDPVAAVAPLSCRACLDMPPAGFKCLACGAEERAGLVLG